MDESTEVAFPSPQSPKDNRRTWIIVGVVAMLICFCCILILALYYGYDYLGDPLGIYGALPQLITAIVA